MRRILTGFVAVALAAAVPTLALAGNQEMADQIAQRLRTSGQMSGYKIGIKCQDGTAWLRGRVTSDEQMNVALKVAFQTPGVTRVVNELTLAEPPTAAAQPVSPPANQQYWQQTAAIANPLRAQGARQNAQAPRKDTLVRRLESVLSRGSETETQARAERLSSSFRSAPVSTISAQEMQEEAPRPMSAPQRARPVAANYMAMQPNMQGQAPPDGRPLPMYTAANAHGAAPARYDQPSLPNYAWPSYAAYPNYAAVTYPKQYSPTAWPYIGPFYPYPQVPLGWRKVTLEWDDGWWFLDFKDQPASCWHR
jgi:hypothetical protein